MSLTSTKEWSVVSCLLDVSQIRTFTKKAAIKQEQVVKN